MLFLLQVATGGTLAHYRVEPGAFYGLDLNRLIPYSLMRTWNLQLAVFWIATAWVGGGTRRVPRPPLTHLPRRRRNRQDRVE